MIESSRLAAHTWLRHGLTTRSDGSVGPATSERADATRRDAVAALGGTPTRLVNGHQVHGATVATVGADRAGTTVPETDGLVTSEPDLPLMVQGADCPLLLLAAPDVRTIAAVHSGWRGTVAGIGAAAVAALAAKGAARDRIEAAVFPGIGPCCFEVGPEVVTAFEGVFGALVDAWHTASTGRPDCRLLDLAAAIRATLVDAGVGSASIDVVTGCTACGGRLWSHRASDGAPERHGLFAVIAAV